MRGLKLFVRPMETTDREAVQTFLDKESASVRSPDMALLGKLLGTLVSVIAIEITAEAVLIHDLVVARELRRKRIARVMLNELLALAQKMERDWLVFGCSAPPEFLKRAGFDEEGRRMVRRVG